MSDHNLPPGGSADDGAAGGALHLPAQRERSAADGAAEQGAARQAAGGRGPGQVQVQGLAVLHGGQDDADGGTAGPGEQVRL